MVHLFQLIIALSTITELEA